MAMTFQLLGRTFMEINYHNANFGIYDIDRGVHVLQLVYCRVDKHIREWEVMRQITYCLVRCTLTVVLNT